MIGILIVSHGTLGESLIHSASHVLGKRPLFLRQLGVTVHDDPEAILPVAEDLIRFLDQGQGVLVLTDVYGATPSNIAAKLLNPGRVEGLAGVNLPGRQTVDDFRSLARSGRTLVAGSLTGVVDAYDLTTHEKRWRYSGELNGSIAFALGADERYVYVPYVGGRLVALNIADGTERWRKTICDLDLYYYASAAPIVAGQLARRLPALDRAAAARAVAALALEAVDLGAPGDDPIYGRGLVGFDLRTDPAAVGARTARPRP